MCWELLAYFWHLFSFTLFYVPFPIQFVRNEYKCLYVLMLVQELSALFTPRNADNSKLLMHVVSKSMWS